MEGVGRRFPGLELVGVDWRLKDSRWHFGCALHYH